MHTNISDLVIDGYGGGAYEPSSPLRIGDHSMALSGSLNADPCEQCGRTLDGSINSLAFRASALSRTMFFCGAQCFDEHGACYRCGTGVDRYTAIRYIAGVGCAPRAYCDPCWQHAQLAGEVPMEFRARVSHPIGICIDGAMLGDERTYVAKRELRAGEFVTTADVELLPPEPKPIEWGALADAMFRDQVRSGGHDSREARLACVDFVSAERDRLAKLAEQIDDNVCAVFDLGERFRATRGDYNGFVDQLRAELRELGKSVRHWPQHMRGKKPRRRGETPGPGCERRSGLAPSTLAENFENRQGAKQ